MLTRVPPPQTAIKNLIEARFDAVSSAEVAQVPTPTSGATAEHDTNGRSPSDDDTGSNGAIEVSLPPSKKQKRESSSEDADARLAAELQAQENRLSRGRVTRGAGVAKPKAKPKPKAAKKKSAKRVRSDDDSDADDSNADGKPKRKAGGGFQKPFNLSYSLADVCGESQVRCSHPHPWSCSSTDTPQALTPASRQAAVELYQG